jgi:hypothetical protein
LSLAAGSVLLLSALSVGLYFVHTSTPNKQPVWQLGLIGFAWLCSAHGVWQFIRRLPTGDIDFDGEHWYFADKVGTLSVGFDGQGCMLVRFEDDLKNSNWLWLQARAYPGQSATHWHDVRRAVYSRAESRH